LKEKLGKGIAIRAFNDIGNESETGKRKY